MSAALNTYNAFKAYANARKLTDFTKANPQAWELVTSVMKLRDSNG